MLFPAIRRNTVDCRHLSGNRWFGVKPKGGIESTRGKVQKTTYEKASLNRTKRIAGRFRSHTTFSCKNSHLEDLRQDDSFLTTSLLFVYNTLRWFESKYILCGQTCRKIGTQSYGSSEFFHDCQVAESTLRMKIRQIVRAI